MASPIAPVAPVQPADPCPSEGCTSTTPDLLLLGFIIVGAGIGTIAAIYMAKAD